MLLKSFLLAVAAAAAAVPTASWAQSPQKTVHDVQLDSGVSLADWLALPVHMAAEPSLEVGAQAAAHINRHGPFRELLEIVRRASSVQALREDAVTTESALAKQLELTTAIDKLGTWPGLLMSRAKAAALAGDGSQALLDIKAWLFVVPSSDPRRATFAELVLASGTDSSQVIAFFTKVADREREIMLKQAKEQAELEARIARRAAKRFTLPEIVPVAVTDALLTLPLFTSLPDSPPIHCKSFTKICVFGCGRASSMDYGPGRGGVMNEMYVWDATDSDGDWANRSEIRVSTASTLGGLLNLWNSTNGQINHITKIEAADGKLFPLAKGNRFSVIYEHTAAPGQKKLLSCQVQDSARLDKQQPELRSGEFFKVSCDGQGRYHLCSNDLGVCVSAFQWPKSAGADIPDYSGSFQNIEKWDYGSSYRTNCSRR